MDRAAGSGVAIGVVTVVAERGLVAGGETDVWFCDELLGDDDGEDCCVCVSVAGLGDCCCGS